MATYKGRKVKLNKVQRGDVKKFKVFVRNKRTGRVQKVNFGAKGMSIGRNDPARRRSFFARFRNYFITGIVVLIPIGITIYLTLFLISISSKIIPKEINPNHYLPYNIPGVEIIIAIIVLLIIGSIFYIKNKKLIKKIPLNNFKFVDLFSLKKKFKIKI